jgi:hypothetical protein
MFVPIEMKGNKLMAKVLGVGGIFFKSPDPQKLGRWYSQLLGLNINHSRV